MTYIDFNSHLVFSETPYMAVLLLGCGCCEGPCAGFIHEGRGASWILIGTRRQSWEIAASAEANGRAGAAAFYWRGIYVTSKPGAEGKRPPRTRRKNSSRTRGAWGTGILAAPRPGRGLLAGQRGSGTGRECPSHQPKGMANSCSRDLNSSAVGII